MAVHEIHRGHGVVHEIANGLTPSHDVLVRLYLALLLGEAAEREAERTQAALRRVDFGAGARYRNPHRRMRLLVRLRQHRALRHREVRALVAETLLRPHLRQHAHVFVPRRLRGIGIRTEAAEFGPRRAAAGADFEPSARHDVEHRAAFGDADHRIDLRHAHVDAVTDADALRLRGDRGQEDLRRRAMRILFEEVMLDRPAIIEAQLVREDRLLDAVVVDALFGVAMPRPRHADFIEDAELHSRTPVSS